MTGLNAFACVDYLIIGSGPRALAFADALIRDSNVRVALVDRNTTPGGAWEETYDFAHVAPFTPSFGALSQPLRTWLAARPLVRPGPRPCARRRQVLTYFDSLVHTTLLASDRVLYFPQSVWADSGQVHSLSSGTSQTINVHRKIVDATDSTPPRPYPHVRCFSSAPDIKIINPFEVSSICTETSERFAHYCVIGAGKTAMDTATFLMAIGIAPEGISWVKPRDSWLLSRPAPGLQQGVPTRAAAALAALETAHTPTDLCLRLEQIGSLTRIFQDMTPTMFHSATSSAPQISALRLLPHVIRKGHVQNISNLGMVLDTGAEPMPADTLYIDCTAGVPSGQTPGAIFQTTRIRLQDTCIAQPSLSAAMIAAVERLCLSDAEKNEILKPLPRMGEPSDFVAMLLCELRNLTAWAEKTNGASSQLGRTLRRDSLTGKIVHHERFQARWPSIARNLQRLYDQSMAVLS